MTMKYIKPEIKILKIENNIKEYPILCGSGKPGHGWGDGGHTGPPGQEDKPPHHSNVSEQIWKNWDEE